MVLTPHDTWHNHGNQGDDPAINLCGARPAVGRDAELDVFRARLHRGGRGQAGRRRRCSPSAFPSDYSQRIYGAGGLMPRFVYHQSRRRHGLADVCLSLRHDARGAGAVQATGTAIPTKRIMIEYVDPTTGRRSSRPSPSSCRCCARARSTLPLKQSASLLLAVRGQRPLDGRRQEDRLEPVRHFRGAGRLWAEHVNRSARPAILFVASDEPTLKALALYQKHGKNKNGDS